MLLGAGIGTPPVVVSDSVLIGDETVAYLFDRYSGSGNVQDESGNGNHGVILGDSSISGSELILPSGSSGIEVLNSVLTGASAFTVSFWLEDVSGSGFFHSHLFKTIPSHPGISLFAYANFMGGTTSYQISSSVAYAEATGTNDTHADGNSHHHCLTYDGSYVRLYIDGVYDPPSGASPVDPTPLTGSLPTFTSGEQFGSANCVGNMQDCRIWNDRAITASEVAFLASLY